MLKFYTCIYRKRKDEIQNKFLLHVKWTVSRIIAPVSIVLALVNFITQLPFILQILVSVEVPQSHFHLPFFVYFSLFTVFQNFLLILSETPSSTLNSSLINIITISTFKWLKSWGLWLTFTSFPWSITEQRILTGIEKTLGNIFWWLCDLLVLLLKLFKNSLKNCY